jgi:hypothetical protein
MVLLFWGSWPQLALLQSACCNVLSLEFQSLLGLGTEDSHFDDFKLQ